jgi:hypothetical protein
MSYQRHGFEYAVLRVVPRVDRGEMINAGVLLYCRPLRFLAARVALDAQRVLALDRWHRAGPDGRSSDLRSAARRGVGWPAGHRPPLPVADGTP